MVTMTVLTSPMKTIVPLEVLVKVHRKCVRMVACVSIPAGFVTVKLIVTMILMRKAATVSNILSVHSIGVLIIDYDRPLMKILTYCDNQ